ncbi:MAG: DUF2220 domain-containing protein [Treponema sp.]|nr:DUF2220 domain-containing protein [Treponema sp.]
MSSWEKRIVDAFLAKYPASVAAGSKTLRLKANKLFPNFENASSSERNLFIKAAERLEKSGMVSLAWNKREEGAELSSIVCAVDDALFASVGLVPPSTRIAPIREAAMRCDLPFFAFLAENLTMAEMARGFDERAVEDFARLALYITQHADQSMTPRALSVALYADSKRLEALLTLFHKMLNKAEAQGVVIPDFSSLNRSYPDTMIAGRMAFRIAGYEMVNESGSIFGLPLSTIQKINEARPLRTRTPSALSIENKETFYALSERISGFDCLFYTGGYPNAAVQALVAILANSGFALYHAGDLDIDGVLILQELTHYAGRTVTPFGMDSVTFDEYAQYGRRLHKNMLNYAHRINETTRSLSGITELITRIEETGMGIEQEIIDYTGLLPESSSSKEEEQQTFSYLSIFKKFFSKLKP